MEMNRIRHLYCFDVPQNCQNRHLISIFLIRNENAGYYRQDCNLVLKGLSHGILSYFEH